MTTKQLMVMKRMWDEGASAKQIAHRLGYTQNYVYWVAMHNREMFPRRNKKAGRCDAATKATYVGLVLSGDIGVCAAARECGVCRGTMRRWVLEAT